MKKLLLAIICTLIKIHLFAQANSNNWYFGANAGITFNTIPPSFLSGGQVNTVEGCATISDNNGNLLFYTDGVTVWDRTHAIMQNGTGLFGNQSSSQSAVIVKAPLNTTMYYIITAPELSSTYPLAFSIVDMTINSGFGALTSLNNPLLMNSTEKVTVTYHSNGTDLWIIGHDNQNTFYAYLCSPSGINTTPVTSIAGEPITNSIQKIGYIKPSSCGNQLSMTYYGNTSDTTLLQLFDFDRTTGVVSNGITLGRWTNVSNGAYGVEFSPDNSKLYTAFFSPAMVFQFDLLAGSPSAIIASIDTIGVSPNTYSGALQAGPDGKIYMSKYMNTYLACIVDPNQPGNLCNYQENYISLNGQYATAGLPYYLAKTNCEMYTGEMTFENDQSILVYPNPFNSNFTISIERQNLKNLSIEVNDVLGRNVFALKENDIGNNYERTFDLNSLPNQIYFINLKIDRELIVKMLIKE